MRALQRQLDNLAEWTGRIAAWLALGLVLVTFTVVVLRYGFSFNAFTFDVLGRSFEIRLITLQESALYLHASLFLLAAAYTLKQDAHVRVDIFYRRFNSEARAWVDLSGALFLLLPFCLFLLWVSWEYVETAWTLREGSPEAGGLPYVYLLKTLMPVSAILITLQGLSQVLASLLTLLAPDEEPS